MALSPDEKKIYINADTTAGQADGSMYFPVKYLTGLESVTNSTATLYFRGPNNTTSTSVIVLITTDFIKEFYTQFVNEINFGDKAVITLAVKNLSVSTTQGGSDFVYVNATAGAIIANDDTTAYEDLQIAEDLDVGGNLDVVGTITGDVTGDVTGNADTATLAVSTSALVVADESTDTTCFPVFVTAATGVTLAAKSGSNLTFNSNSGLLTATLLAGNLTGDVTGNADTATALATARAINGVDFDGSAPITVTAAGSTLSDTVTVAKGGTGLTTVGTGNILTGNGTGALTSEAHLSFSTDRLTIGNGGEDIQPFVRFLNDENTLEIGLSNAADDYVTGSADGDVVINSAGDYNVIIAQNDTAALTINTDGDVVTAGSIQLGHATDTTIARSASGVVTIEGKQIVTAGAVGVASEAQAPIGTMVARRTITQAEANSMHSTPIEIVPAQGANTVIIPLGGMIRIDRATTQSNSSTDWNMHYADQEPGAYLTASIHHIRRFMYNEAGDRIYHITPGLASTEVAQNLTDDVNKAVEVSFDSAATTNAFTSMDVYLTYYVISIA